MFVHQDDIAVPLFITDEMIVLDREHSSAAGAV